MDSPERFEAVQNSDGRRQSITFQKRYCPRPQGDEEAWPVNQV